ncbi:MAG: MFS transporter [bacterium]
MKTVQENNAGETVLRLPLWRSLMYSAGNLSNQFLTWTFITYLSFYYSPPEGKGLRELLPIGVTTAVLAIGRILDGFLEPVVGYWSDRTRSRWGRRIPFIMFGGLPMCIFFLLLWLPPYPNNITLTTLHLIITNTGFWFCITIIFCPYLALLPEIAQSSQDRVFISQLMQVFLMIGTGVVMILPAYFKTNYGHPEMYIIITLLGLAAIYMPVIGIPEKKLTIAREAEEDYSIIDALKWTFTNKAFLIYVISSLFMLLGFQTVLNTFLYVITVLLGKPESFLAVVFAFVVVSIFISFVLIYKLTAKYSKKSVLACSYLSLAMVLPLIYFLDYETFFGIPTFYAACALFFILGVPIAGIICLGLPIIADIADYDEKLTGKRREAMFFGAQGILQKYTIGLTFFIQGFLFNRYGYSEANPLGIKLLGPVTSIFVLIGLLVFIFYPLDEKSLTLKPLWRLNRKKHTSG